MPARVVASLLIVYVAWGATYPAIAVLVRTVPPLLGMGARFLIGLSSASDARRARRFVACVAGFGGLAIVVGPGGGGALGWFAVLVAAAAFEASGEVGGSHVPQIPEALWATVLQLLGAGAALTVAGVAAGELSGIEWAAMDGDTLLAFGFLVIVGSVLAYPALVWLLANTPTSTAATYAYVNPVVALVLGAVLLDERVSVAALVGAAIVLGSVVVVVRQDVSA